MISQICVIPLTNNVLKSREVSWFEGINPNNAHCLKMSMPGVAPNLSSN